MGELCQEIGAYARDLLLVASGANTADLGRTRQEVANMSVLAQTLSEDMLIRVLKAMSGAVSEMRNSDNPRLVVDMNLLGLLLEDEAAGTGEMATGTIVSKMSAKARTPSSGHNQDTKRP